MSEAQNDNVTELEFQNLRALVEKQRSAFRAEGEVTLRDANRPTQET